VLCQHGGNALAVAPSPRVRAAGQPVSVQAVPYTVAGCTNPPPPQNVGPCLTALWVRAAVRVRASGVPVVLSDSQAICSPTGTPLSVAVVQPRVRGT
jgi:hypothetical protein